MARMTAWLAVFGLVLGLSAPTGRGLQSNGNPNYKANRVNRAIELREAGQFIFGTTARGGDGYNEGLRLTQTGADYITYEMENDAFDLSALRQFMEGLVASGPTKTGHATPAVIVTLPVLGVSEESIRANYWMIHQTLSTGVHGILLCHARDPGAVELFVASSRYPFARPELGSKGLPEGTRGGGSQTFAAKIWGVTLNQYMDLADPRPLNPRGELLLGMKMEDKYAVERARELAAVPGVAFAEWGPNDMTLSVLGLENIRAGGTRTGPPGSPPPVQTGFGPLHPDLARARTTVFDALKANKKIPLDVANNETIMALIAEGVRVSPAYNEGVAAKARAFLKREMPYRYGGSTAR
jgi:4-hydroxy-2-oxoheptanedioate aldolase